MAPPVSGYSVWYDASDAASITASAGKVSQWNDKSGNGIHLAQATSTQQPATGALTQNGLNVISFDSIDDNMHASGVTNLAANGGTMFVVNMVGACDTPTWLAGAGTAGGATVGLTCVNSNRYAIQADYGTNGYTSTADCGTPHIVTYKGGSTMTLRIDGRVDAGFTSGSATTDAADIRIRRVVRIWT